MMYSICIWEASSWAERNWESPTNLHRFIGEKSSKKLVSWVKNGWKRVLNIHNISIQIFKSTINWHDFKSQSRDEISHNNCDVWNEFSAAFVLFYLDSDLVMCGWLEITDCSHRTTHHFAPEDGSSGCRPPLHIELRHYIHKLITGWWHIPI